MNYQIKRLVLGINKNCLSMVTAEETKHLDPDVDRVTNAVKRIYGNSFLIASICPQWTRKQQCYLRVKMSGPYYFNYNSFTVYFSNVFYLFHKFLVLFSNHCSGPFSFIFLSDELPHHFSGSSTTRRMQSAG